MLERPKDSDGGAWGSYVQYIQDLEYLVEKLEHELADTKKRLMLCERQGEADFPEGDRPATG